MAMEGVADEEEEEKMYIDAFQGCQQLDKVIFFPSTLSASIDSLRRNSSS